jgi:hypothetical protein
MNLNNRNEISRAAREETKLAWLELVREQIASLRFGTVLITVHDSRVVQVEKNEKVRLDQPPSASAKPSA